MHIGNYICKIASMEEMEQKWDYEIAQHSERETGLSGKTKQLRVPGQAYPSRITAFLTEP